MRYIKTKFGVYPVLRGNERSKIESEVNGKPFEFGGKHLNEIIDTNEDLMLLLDSIVTNGKRFYPPFDFAEIMEHATSSELVEGKRGLRKVYHYAPIHGYVWTMYGDRWIAEFKYCNGKKEAWRRKR